MKFICLVYHEEEKLGALSPDELATLAAQCGAWVRHLAANGHYVSSAALQSVRTAVTVRKRNGKISATDGPFAETKEFLGGFTILEARDMNQAIQLASKLPAARLASIEVRPLLEPEAELTDAFDRKIAAAMALHGESRARED
jgi:hypothetical protein